jgi:hypothetical protein
MHDEEVPSDFRMIWNQWEDTNMQVSNTKYRVSRNVMILAVGLTILGLGWMPAVAQNGGTVASADAAKKANSPASMPRTADGHPIFNGVWGAGAGGSTGVDTEAPARGGAAGAAAGPGIVARHTLGETGALANVINYERDKVFTRRMSTNKPIYKPEYWELVKKMDRTNNDNDPTFSCMPAGVPRMGAPNMIIQTPTLMAFFYSQGAGAAGAQAAHRFIAMDGRKHTPIEDLDGTWFGESIGHWEGDTLVIDTIGFNNSSWLFEAGYIHSEDMHVVERMHREGNTMIWEATVEDPEMLMQPWVMDKRTMRLNPDPNALLPEASPCMDIDHAHVATKERS